MINGKMSTVTDVNNICLVMGELVSLLEKDHVWDQVTPAKVRDSITVHI